MENEMEDKIDAKIDTVLNLIRTNNTAVEALNISQALLNMAHAKNMLWNTEHNKQQVLAEANTTKKSGTGT